MVILGLCFLLTDWLSFREGEKVRLKLDVQGQEGGRILDVVGQGGGGYFWHVTASSSLLYLVLRRSIFTSNNVTECFDFHIYYKSTSCRFYYKGLQVLL